MNTKKFFIISGIIVLLLLVAFYLLWRRDFWSLGERRFSGNDSSQRVVKQRFPVPETITPNFTKIGYLSAASEIGGVDFYYYDDNNEEQWKKLVFERYSFCRLDEEDYCLDTLIPHGQMVQVVGTEEILGEVTVIEIQKID